MAIRKQTAIWRGRNNQRWRLCDMDTLHLLNVRNFLKRRVENAIKLNEDAVQEEKFRYTKTTPKDIIVKIILELERRGVNNVESTD